MSKRQAEIPGTERKVIKEVSDAAAGYVTQRDKRMKLSKKEKEAKDALIAAMKKHGVQVYRDTEAVPPFLVTVTSTDTVKVETEGDGEEAAADD